MLWEGAPPLSAKRDVGTLLRPQLMRLCLRWLCTPDLGTRPLLERLAGPLGANLNNRIDPAGLSLGSWLEAVLEKLVPAGQGRSGQAEMTKTLPTATQAQDRGRSQRRLKSNSERAYKTQSYLTF